MLYGVFYLSCLLLILLLGMHPQQPNEVGYVLSTSLIAMLSIVITFNPWSRDFFQPIKLVSALYGMSFGIGPLFIGANGFYQSSEALLQGGAGLGASAIIALIGFIVLISSYYLTPPYGGAGFNRRSIEGRCWPAFVRSGMIVGAIGLASYVLLVVRSGGIGHFLSYTGGRADIFEGTYGGLFWGTFFILSGYSIFCMARIGKSRVEVGLVTLVISGMYMLFQGRESAVTPMIIFGVFYHYLCRPLTTRQILVGVSVVLLVVSLLGVYRATDKAEVGAGWIAFIAGFLADAEAYVTHTIARDIERLSILAVAYQYLEDGGQALSGRSLISWLGPINRSLFNGYFDIQPAGPYLFSIIYPYHEGRSGAAPSITGELYLNFRMPGVIAGLALYGVAMKLLSRIINRKHINTLLLAVYPYALVLTTLVVIAGTHALFKIMVVAGGVYGAYILAGRRSGRFHSVSRLKRRSLRRRDAGRGIQDSAGSTVS